MKRKVKELKRIARGNLEGQYRPMIKALVWVNLILLLVEFPFSMLQTKELFSTSNVIYYVAQILINIIAIILICGQYKMHLSLARTGTVKESDVFYMIKNQPDRYITANLILFGMSLIALLPAGIGLFLIYSIPSVSIDIAAIALCAISMILSLYLALTYNLVFFLMTEDEALLPIAALKQTRQFIRTHRRRYLYLQCSFLGLMLATALSLGIGLLWLEPYITQTITLFYLDTKGELDAIQTERRKTQEPTVINHYV